VRYLANWAGALVVLALALPVAQCQEKPFQWLDFKRDTDLLAKVMSALRETEYTHVREVGLVGNHALAVTSTRPKDVTDFGFYTDLDRYQAFAVDLENGKARQIWSGYDFEMAGEANFETSAVPDMLFRYKNCVECEPGTYLASFAFDSERTTWTLRRWDKEDAVLIDAALYEEPWQGEFAYAVTDLDGDGFDDIGAWIVERNTKTGISEEHLRLYTFKDGRELVTTPTLANALELKRKICAATSVVSGGQDGKACVGVTRSSRTKSKTVKP